MLHIFLSNRPGEVRYGTTGKPVPGYQLRIVDDEGGGRRRRRDRRAADQRPEQRAQATGTTASGRAATFVGEWTRTGDKYSVDEDGYYTYGGRSDDMLKVGGIYVSPFEVEAALVTHPDVLEVGRHRRAPTTSNSSSRRPSSSPSPACRRTPRSRRR